MAKNPWEIIEQEAMRLYNYILERRANNMAYDYHAAVHSQPSRRLVAIVTRKLEGLGIRIDHSEGLRLRDTVIHAALLSDRGKGDEGMGTIDQATALRYWREVAQAILADATRNHWRAGSDRFGGEPLRKAEEKADVE